MKTTTPREHVYCLARCSDGRWLVLNRSYRPWGQSTSGWVDYNVCRGLRLWLRDKDLQQLDGGQRPYRCGDRQLWLYHERSAPGVSRKMRADYRRKLKLLGLDDVDETTSDSIGDVLDHDAQRDMSTRGQP